MWGEGGWVLELTTADSLAEGNADYRKKWISTSGRAQRRVIQTPLIVKPRSDPTGLDGRFLLALRRYHAAEITVGGLPPEKFIRLLVFL